MTEGDVYEATEQYSDHIAYIHFRNVKGKVPNYKEVFVDEGEIDMFKILKILKHKNFNGVLIPDHTPQISCDAPWHAGMAYTLGFMNAALKMI
jgi:mannonate dehydratase